MRAPSSFRNGVLAKKLFFCFHSQYVRLFSHAKQQPLQGRPHRARYDFFEGLASLAVYDLTAQVAHAAHAEVSQPNHDISDISTALTYSEGF
jgi:hypothetical protein